MTVARTAREHLQATWSDVEFEAHGYNILWEDGPTVKQVVSFLARYAPGLPWRALRTISYQAWALERGPLLPNMETLTWDGSERRLLAFYHNEIKNVEATLEHTDLSAMFALASARDLTQAEIASRIHPLQNSFEHGLFDMWLRQGGWAMAGTLLDT